MKKLAQENKDEVIDLLSERLAFERSGVRLYDKVLEVMKASDDDAIAEMLEEMQEHRDQEKEHELWLEEQIRQLGGDASVPSEKADLVTRESKGIEEVIMSDPELPHLFHALLAAELVDNAGWDLLVQLADEVGDREARKAFAERLHHEEEHLIFLKKIVEEISLADVTGVAPELPTSDEEART